jgi:catechol 2,3-dioxygenase-like lactoylglutathione lyase family enzyme
MELRLVLTVADLDRALALYRDGLGLVESEHWEDGILLDAGRATLELQSERGAAAIDKIEVGRRVAGPVRVAFAVDDSDAVARRLEAAGAERVAGPVTTPWGDRNVRLRTEDGMQLTLFAVVV